MEPVIFVLELIQNQPYNVDAQTVMEVKEEKATHEEFSSS